MSTELPIAVKHERLHALDALRAFAMMLGVWLHMAIPYTEGVPRGFWPAYEQDSVFVGLSMLTIHSWRMELFFMLSGFFTAMLVVRRGVRSVAIHRAKRIALPFVIALPVIGSLCVLVWGIGFADLFPGSQSTWIQDWFRSSWGMSTDFIPAKFGRLWHLWFLYVLIYLIAIGLFAHWLLAKPLAPFNKAISRFMGWGVRSWWGMFVLAVPLGLVQILIGSPNGPAPAESLMPDIRSIEYHALPFFGGWYLFAQREAISVLAKRFWWPLTVALAIALPAHLMSLTKTMEDMTDVPEGITTPMTIACMSRGLLTVSFGLGIIGLCTFLLSAPSERGARLIRYISDSAYWVYLVHMPLVALLSVWLFQPLNWPATIEVLAGSIITMIVLLVSYELFVRYTPIGTLLNGKRTRARHGFRPASAQAEVGASAHPVNRQPHEEVPPRSS
jgi:surface polysaccharide O-acyltransferase-like enzyme